MRKKLLALCMMSLMMPGCGEKKQDTAVKAEVPVYVTSITTRNFEDVISVEATVHPKNFCLVSPRVPGVIDGFFVHEGDEIQEGAPLFKTEDEKLIKAVMIARQNLKLAECAKDEKQASHEKNGVKLLNTEREFERARKMMADKAISQSAFDNASTNYETEKANMRHFQTLLNLAAEDAERAKIALQLAEKDLKDSTVNSPMSGVVVKKLVEAGEMGSPGIPVLRIEDLKNLEVRGHIPAHRFSRVNPGETRARIRLNGTIAGLWPVTWKSPVVDNRFHTFETRVDLTGDGISKESQNGDISAIKSGMTVQLSILMEEKTALAVYSDCIVQRTGSAAVFLADNTKAGAKARLLKVRSGLVMDHFTEISGENVKDGTMVISRGQLLVDDGTPIKIMKE